MGLRWESMQPGARAALTTAAGGARTKRALAASWLAGAEGVPQKVARRRVSQLRILGLVTGTSGGSATPREATDAIYCNGG
eukprot:241105-Pleurochrysis_carterae.AAC.1